jgi:Fe-S-cluster-containing dehydrogenase component
MEMANVTYLDDSENIKVKINHEKCIDCGACVTACKHDARQFVDDTERFFNDLSDGVSISLMAAPSIKTNIPGYKRLFTYLKQLGVKHNNAPVRACAPVVADTFAHGLHCRTDEEV